MRISDFRDTFLASAYHLLNKEAVLSWKQVRMRIIRIPTIQRPGEILNVSYSEMVGLAKLRFLLATLKTDFQTNTFQRCSMTTVVGEDYELLPHVLIFAINIIPDLSIIYFVNILVTVEVDKIPYTLQLCDISVQASWLIKVIYFCPSIVVKISVNTKLFVN